MLCFYLWGKAESRPTPVSNYLPVPFNVTVTGDVAELLLITTLAVRGPVAVGWNFTLMLQSAPGTKLVVAAVVHVPAWSLRSKSPELSTTWEITKG